MSIFKCKMCGGELSFNPGDSTGVCDYCGTEQTLPKVKDENLQGLFNRANTLRIKAEFDKAADIYEKILQANGTEAEAYWGLILCKYGIEYVEDPATFKRVPTCHRASYDAVTTDDDYKMAIQYADLLQRKVYEAEAKQIDEIQKGIIALAQKEEPYDVFICYKETDDNGQRTQDSVIANDIYYQLTQEGFKVFYAAITLEDKLGQEYEPYIFSALNSAKVMLSIGTKPEFFNAVWVKNEWSRFLKIMKKDRARMLIPCYRDMDAYELPEEFAHLQAQDMSKIGFINDIVRGIKKVVVKDNAIPGNTQSTNSNTLSSQTFMPQTNGNVQALLDRGYMALEFEEWKEADEFFEKVLNQDAKCAKAYLGKLLVSYKCAGTEELFQRIIKENDYPNEKEVKNVTVDQSEHIEKMVGEYDIPGYFDKNTIKGMYKYSMFSYGSYTSNLKVQKEDVIHKFRENKLIKTISRLSDEEIKNKIENVIQHLDDEWDRRVAESKENDTVSEKKIIDNYDKFINDTDKKVKEQYQVALERKNCDEERRRIEEEKEELKKKIEEESKKKKEEESKKKKEEESKKKKEIKKIDIKK